MDNLIFYLIIAIFVIYISNSNKRFSKKKQYKKIKITPVITSVNLYILDNKDNNNNIKKDINMPINREKYITDQINKQVDPFTYKNKTGCVKDTRYKKFYLQDKINDMLDRYSYDNRWKWDNFYKNY